VYFRITRDSTELVDPRDMASFHVLCPAGLGRDELVNRVRADGLGELLPGDDHLLIPVDVIRRYAGDAVDPGWERDLAGMIGYASRKGWMSDDGSRVRAHVERTA